MDYLIQLLKHHWQFKLLSIITAIVIWFSVNHSITEVKTIPNVPIRVVNLPQDKTIPGLLPNGVLAKRVTLTLSGTKEVIDSLEPGDMEVLLDASTADRDDWIINISKKNLISLDPSIDLAHNVTDVGHNDFIVKLSPLVTAKIPVLLQPPVGEAPKGYEFLDIWPQKLMQTVSGPQSEIDKLKDAGLELTFNLSDIGKADLDAMKPMLGGAHSDEVSFPVPKKWKRLIVPFNYMTTDELNDPEAANLRINFLRKNLLPLGKRLPIRVFYPLQTIETLNPQTTSLAVKNDIVLEDGVYTITLPLYVSEVSQLFLDTVRDNLELVILAAPKSEREFLRWSLQVLDTPALEEAYVAAALGVFATTKTLQPSIAKRQEELLRTRFRDYLEKLTLYIEQDKRLKIRSFIQSGLSGNNQIVVEFR